MIVACLAGVAASSSVFSILAMSMDRFLAIRHPIIYRRLFNKRVARCVIVVIWIVACLLFLPVMLVRQTVSGSQKHPISLSLSLSLSLTSRPHTRRRAIFPNVYVQSFH